MTSTTATPAPQKPPTASLDSASPTDSATTAPSTPRSPGDQAVTAPSTARLPGNPAVTTPPAPRLPGNPAAIDAASARLPGDIAVAPAPAGGAAAVAAGQPNRASGTKLLLLLGIITTIAPFSFDMYLPAFPELARDLNAAPSAVTLTLTACLIGIALGQLVVGPLSDRYGRRRPIIFGLLGFSLFSLLCVFAPNVEILIGLRFVQGFAVGAGGVIGRAIVRDLYSGAEAAKYFSRLTLVFGIAPVLAPSVGALVLRFTTWRGTFVILTVIGLAVAFTVSRLLPETLPPSRRRTGGLSQLTQGAKVLMRDRVFVGYALSQGFSFAGMFAYLSAGSFVLQDVYGLTAQHYGIAFGANALGLVGLGQLNAYLVTRHRPRRLLLISLSVSAVAGTGLVLAAGFGLLLLMLPMLFAYIATIGMSASNSTALALDRHPEMAGTAAALAGAVQSAIGVTAAPLVGAAGIASGLPMTAVMAAFSALALLTVLLLTRPRPHLLPLPR